MRYARTIGNNISIELKKKGLTYEDLAKETGYSVDDIHRIVEGYLLLDSEDMDLFSLKLGVSKAQLLNERNLDEYRGLIHCMGEFHDYTNVEKILDYIDDYVIMEHMKEQQ